jgi:DNA replication licensing factor MCM4
MDDIKRGILCQLFGGTIQGDLQAPAQEEGGGHEGDDDDFFLNEGKEDGGGGSGRAKAPDSVRDKSHHRSDVNILLIGDPGTSKSQLLSYVHKVMEK